MYLVCIVIVIDTTLWGARYARRLVHFTPLPSTPTHLAHVSVVVFGWQCAHGHGWGWAGAFELRDESGITHPTDDQAALCVRVRVKVKVGIWDPSNFAMRAGSLIRRTIKRRFVLSLVREVRVSVRVGVGVGVWVGPRG